MRYFIRLSYRGTNYHGWQIQPQSASVQETLNNKLSVFLREPISVTGAGRTDTGVHARDFIGHFDSKSNKLHNDTQLIYQLNQFLPEDIVIHQIYQVHKDAHARFDATSRTYKYYISTKKDVFYTMYNWLFYRPLDFQQLQLACDVLFKHNDFTSFSKVNTDVKTNNCKVTHANWEKVGDQLIFTITADRFLRNMVRAIVGTMVNIGLKKINITDFERIIKQKNRSVAGETAPAHALFLVNIKYPFELY